MDMNVQVNDDDDGDDDDLILLACFTSEYLTIHISGNILTTPCTFFSHQSCSNNK